MKEQNIFLLVVLVAVVLPMALGLLWYSELFEEAWMDKVNLDLATIEANPPGAGVLMTSIFSTALAMFVLTWL